MSKPCMTCVSAQSSCQACYHCEQGVAPFVTAEMWKSVKGNPPAEWILKTPSAGSGEDCKKCYDCQRCISLQDGQGGGEGRPIETTYFLFPTNECNLRCTYCYATKTPKKMTPQVLDQLKRFLTESEDLRLGTNRNIAIQFFGGEPTMEWEILENFVMEFSDLVMRRYGKGVRWGMTSNGTLLNEERLKFMQLYGFKLLLSLDGRKETHNVHRKKRDGSGSFEDIPLDLIIKYYPECEIRPTITTQTVGNWLDDLLWFHSKGLYNVATEVAYEDNWDEDSLIQARQLFLGLAELYVRMKKEGKKFWMKFIDDVRNSLPFQEQKGFVCGVARGSLGIDSEGLLYSCQRFAAMGDRTINLGNVFSGFDEHKLREAQSLRREGMFPHDPQFECETCVARFSCRGGCNAMNFQVCGDRKAIPRNHCIFHQMWAEIALKTLSRTRELWRAGANCNRPLQVGQPQEKKES